MAAGSPTPWDTAVIRDCPVRAWSGDVWRCHRRKYAGNEAGGFARVTGRFNRGTDKFAAHATWPALYTSLAPHVALGERLRHTTPDSLSQLSDQRLSRLRVTLHVVLDQCAASGCAEIGLAGLDFDDLCRPRQYDKTHQLAQIARDLAEALLAPSRTRFPDGNFIIFPDRLAAGSTIVVVETQDPDLFVDWEKA